MATNKLTALDIVLSLPPKDRAKLLAALRQTEPSVCERLGHSYKPFKQYSTGFLGSGPTVVVLVCSKCGHSITK